MHEDYDFFLFSMLYNEIYKEEASNQDYSTMYGTCKHLFHQFSNSPYDDSDIDLYTCIVDFLNDSKQLIITYAEETN